jgi:hypothetical protein
MHKTKDRVTRIPLKTEGDSGAPEETNPFLALRVYVKMSEIHETGGV